MSDCVSLSDPRSMNGHTQSGGHWNAAFWMMTTGSGDVGTPQWSSRSVDGSASGILYIWKASSNPLIAWRRVPWLCHQKEEAGDGEGVKCTRSFTSHTISLT